MSKTLDPSQTTLSATPASRADVLAALHASEAGLTSAEAASRLQSVGPNEAAGAREAGALAQLVPLVTNPLVVILLIASVASAALGDRVNAFIIATMVLLSVALNFIQTYRSQQAASRLQAQVAPTASVLRDGEWRELARRELVPGDIIRLSAGDLVPADARLLTARDLHVQQAALTGESLPVEKDARDGLSPGAARLPLSSKERRSGGEVASAERANMVLLGTSVVSGIGTAVVVATGLATQFGDIAARLRSRAPETEFERGIRRFGFLILRTVVFLVLFVLVVNLAFHRDPFESLLFAVALAVGLTPEFLPMITTVTLGQGALRMARKKVIVKHLAAIENFGSMDILCSDKTGTITSGEMALDQMLAPAGEPSERPLQLAALNSKFETGIRSPLDVAILAHPRANAIPFSDYTKLDEIPFDFERRRLSIVVAHTANGDSGGERLLITKGAPEGILPLCTSYDTPNGPAPLTGSRVAPCEETYQRLEAQGYRVLAVAYRSVPQQAAYSIADEQDLTLAGYVAFFDPPLEDAPQVLAALRRDGIQVKILTGDSDLVARHICECVGLDGAQVVLGDDIDRMTDPALAQVAEAAHVFARVSPAQKNRILLALKARGHVVGFMGDGINDAPSLHAADVGISVASAVDVAKDAAEIILMEHSLTVLDEGVLEGRKAFGNVMKYLLMGTSSNFGNMFSMAGAALFLPFLPMLPTQILLNNFLYDLSQVTIPTDNVDATFIQQPHRWDIHLIRNFMIFIGPISSIYDFLTFFLMLHVFHASEALFHTGWFVESLATQTLVLFVIRTAGNPFKSRPSRPLTLTTLSIVAVGIILPFSPLAPSLGFTPLPGLYFLFLTVMTLTYLLLVEIGKRFLLSRHPL